MPGLNAGLVAEIIAYREDIGDILDWEELTEIPGIDLELAFSLRKYLFFYEGPG